MSVFESWLIAWINMKQCSFLQSHIINISHSWHVYDCGQSGQYYNASFERLLQEIDCDTQQLTSKLTSELALIHSDDLILYSICWFVIDTIDPHDQMHCDHLNTPKSLIDFQDDREKKLISKASEWLSIFFQNVIQ